MSLFGLGDITFNKNNTKGFGPLSALEDSVKYRSNTFRYPIDVGNYDKGHYMVFYIREQSKTQYKGAVANESDIPIRKSAGNITNTNTIFGGELLNKVNSGLSQINSSTGSSLSELKNLANKVAGGLTNKISSGLGNIFGQSKLFRGNSESTSAVIDTSIKKITNKSLLNPSRNTILTTDAVALYMPDTLMFTHSQEYQGLTPGQEGLGQLSGQLAQSLRDNGNFDISQLAGFATLKGKEFITKVTGSRATVEAGAFAALGAVVNPMLELLYTSPAFRTFQFDFAFYPRDEKEAMEVQKIIERFRFHQAPELDISNGKQTGLLIPPSEFDIKFYYGGGQNPNIPPIGTCVLTTIDVNYAPNGFSAYEVPGELEASRGRTGMPTAINLTLQFQETTYLTKEDFRDDREDGFKKY